MSEDKIRLLMKRLQMEGYQVSRHGYDALVYRDGLYVASIHIYPLARKVTVKRYVLNPEAGRHVLRIAGIVERVLEGCRVLLRVTESLEGRGLEG